VYEVVDARVVYPTGEGEQWTPDGKGVVILGGAYEAGNVDDIEVDLATGKVNRVTANLDYDRTVYRCSTPVTVGQPAACRAGIPPVTPLRSGNPASRTQRSHGWSSQT
jgi:hypothetical protein